MMALAPRLDVDVLGQLASQASSGSIPEPGWQPVAPTPPAPTAPTSLVSPGAQTMLPAGTGVAPQGAAPLSGSRYRSVSEVPEVRWEDYTPKDPRPKDTRSWWEQMKDDLTSSDTIGDKAKWKPSSEDWQKSRDRYLTDRLNRLSNIAMLAGKTLPERKAIRETVRVGLQGQVQVGDKVKDAASLSNDEWVAAVEQQIGQFESDLQAQGIERSAFGSVADESQQGTLAPQEIAMLQASIGQFMQPFIQQVAAGGTPADQRLAAAYMAQAQALPTIAAYEQNQALQQQVAGLQNQLMQQQYASGSGLDAQAMAALLNQGG